MIDKLKNIFKLTPKDLVKWSDLQSLPYFKWIDLKTGQEDVNNGVVYMKIKTNVPDQLLFITKGEKGLGYDSHYHDCKETIICIEGTCVINDKTTLKPFERYYCQRNTRHKVYAGNDPFTLLVEFNK